MNGQLDPGTRQAVEQLATDLRRTAEGEDIAAIRDAMSRLEEATAALSQNAYQQVPEGNGYHNGADSEAMNHPNEEVVEGEFRQV